MANFYSDTQTHASRAMCESILNIPLGDENHDEDPCKVELCAKVAEMLGMEAAVFLPCVIKLPSRYVVGQVMK
jgi:threonine aldolase